METDLDMLVSHPVHVWFEGQALNNMILSSYSNESENVAGIRWIGEHSIC
jgi:hypothetical protein